MSNSYAGNVATPSMQNTFAVPQAQSGAYSGVTNLGTTYGGIGQSVLPQATQTAQNLYSNPYSGLALGGNTGAGGAQGAFNLGTASAYTGYGVGGGQIGTGSGLIREGQGLNATGQNITQEGQSLVPYASQLWQSGFDPQSPLYNQQFQLSHDQANVANAQAGVSQSPYGAGVVDQADQNFNMNWENQQLARQAQAAQAASGVLGEAGQLAQTGAGIQQTGAGITQTGTGIQTGGVGLQQQAPSQLIQSAMIPYATYQQIGQGQTQALQDLLSTGTSGANLSNMSVQDLMAYLGIQNTTQSVANQTAQVGVNQAQVAGNQLSQIGQGVGNLFSQFL